eukprot:TRINITY_DN47819_c0_g1_i1.p1 TRINITY_DN47819_c0_g1~~TRINITY_DN47819_c0_g1_i1.p1  ORF type:complete len:369 (+),score=30.83 TRINITY_DN47819_c0_g1_i1:150-1256(+)
MEQQHKAAGSAGKTLILIRHAHSLYNAVAHDGPSGGFFSPTLIDCGLSSQGYRQVAELRNVFRTLSTDSATLSPQSLSVPVPHPNIVSAVRNSELVVVSPLTRTLLTASALPLQNQRSVLVVHPLCREWCTDACDIGTPVHFLPARISALLGAGSRSSPWGCPSSVVDPDVVHGLTRRRARRDAVVSRLTTAITTSDLPHLWWAPANALATYREAAPAAAAATMATAPEAAATTPEIAEVLGSDWDGSDTSDGPCTVSPDVASSSAALAAMTDSAAAAAGSHDDEALAHILREGASESPAALADRVRAFARWLADRREQTITVVSHSDFLFVLSGRSLVNCESVAVPLDSLPCWSDGDITAALMSHRK